MKTYSTVALSAIALLLVQGCAARLEVYNKDGEAQKGIPIRSPILVEITTKTTYKIAPHIASTDPNYATIQELCRDTIKKTTSFLPLGEVNYINYDPALFANSQFKLDYTDTGGTKSISVNSDPAATTQSASNLLGTVLPFVTTPKTAGLVQAQVQDLEALRKRSCIKKSEAVVEVREKKILQAQ